MLILAIDPGPERCGVVLYDAAAGVVRLAWADMPVAMVAERLIAAHPEMRPFCAGQPYALPPAAIVAIERVQSAGIAGASLLQTSEVVGRLQQAAAFAGYTVRLVYRREVCSALHVHGAGKDAQVRQRMLEMHPGGVGTKKAPGPLYGVTSHAWQALGLAVAVAGMDARP